MRIFIAVVFATLGVWLALGAPNASAAGSSLGESRWSAEVGTWVGSGSSDRSIAVRRHTGANTAWRLAVYASVFSFDGDGTYLETGSPDAPVARFEDYHDYVFTLQWMHFATIRDGLAVTLGVGPFYENRVDAYRYTHDAGLPTYYEDESRAQIDLYGLELGLGTEWFFSRRFSLGGLVGLRAGLGTRTDTDIHRDRIGAGYTIEEIGVESDMASLETMNGRILLSIYF